MLERVGSMMSVYVTNASVMARQEITDAYLHARRIAKNVLEVYPLATAGHSNKNRNLLNLSLALPRSSTETPCFSSPGNAFLMVDSASKQPFESERWCIKVVILGGEVVLCKR
jgi:hypothetical protein